MFTQKNEKLFFISHINQDSKILEYGSGESTLEIAKIAKSIVSVEHQPLWYSKTINLLSNNTNCKLLLKPPDKPYVEGGHCGTYDQFKNYVNAPISYAPYDIILIDGRARVACASKTKDLGINTTIVFIHDFDRPEYQEALRYLELIETVGTMAKFKIK